MPAHVVQVTTVKGHCALPAPFNEGVANAEARTAMGGTVQDDRIW